MRTLLPAKLDSESRGNKSCGSSTRKPPSDRERGMGKLTRVYHATGMLCHCDALCSSDPSLSCSCSRLSPIADAQPINVFGTMKVPISIFSEVQNFVQVLVPDTANNSQPLGSVERPPSWRVQAFRGRRRDLLPRTLPQIIASCIWAGFVKIVIQAFIWSIGLPMRFIHCPLPLFFGKGRNPRMLLVWDTFSSIGP